MSVEQLSQEILDGLSGEFLESKKIQVIDSKSGKALDTIGKDKAEVFGDIVGGSEISNVINIFSQEIAQNSEDLEKLELALTEQTNVSDLKISPSGINEGQFVVSFDLEGRYFEIMNIPNSDLIVTVSVDKQEITTAGNDLGLQLSIISGLLDN